MEFTEVVEVQQPGIGDGHRQLNYLLSCFEKGSTNQCPSLGLMETSSVFAPLRLCGTTLFDHGLCTMDGGQRPHPHWPRPICALDHRQTPLGVWDRWGSPDNTHGIYRPTECAAAAWWLVDDCDMTITTPALRVGWRTIE